jgi:hypothetical protein
MMTPKKRMMREQHRMIDIIDGTVAGGKANPIVCSRKRGKKSPPAEAAGGKRTLPEVLSREYS